MEPKSPKENERKSDVEEGEEEEGEDQPLISQGKLASMALHVCWYARVAELAFLLALIVNFFEASGCTYFSYAVLGLIGGILWHITFLIVPLRGKLKMLKFFRIASPMKSLLIIGPSVGGVFVLYFVFLGGCPALRNTVLLGIVPCGLYGLAIWRKETGKEFLCN